MRRYFSLLRGNPAYRLLFAAQSISFLGDWFNTIAVVILVNRYTDSPLAVGGLFLARSLPVFVFGPLAGVFADRFNRKWILFFSDFSRIFVVLGFLLVDSPQNVWLVYVLCVLQFSISAFPEPAIAAILPALVEREDLMTANTLINIIWSVTLAFGGALGGVAVGLLGVRIALLVDAATFALSALLILFLRPRPRAESPHTRRSHWGDFMAGLRYLLRTPNIALIACVKGLIQVGSIDIAIAVYAERVFTYGTDGATTLGVLFAAFGVGAVISPIFADQFGRGERHLMRWIALGFALVALGWLIFGLASNIYLAVLGVFLRGFGGSINWTYSSVLLQIKVQDDFLGRVFGFDFTLFTLALSIGVVVTAAGAEWTGERVQGWFVGVALASLAPFILWVLNQREALRRLPAPSAGD